MSDYHVKWKGQSNGPYSVEELRRMFEDREIGPMHEILSDGKWVTARTFFRRDAKPDPQSSPSKVVTDSAQNSPFASAYETIPTSLSEPIKVAPSEEAPSALQASQAYSPPFAADLILFAGFWQRATALLLDLLLIVGLPLWALDAFGPYDIFTFSGLLELTPQTWIIGGVGFLLAFWIYSTVLESSPLHATFGKLALGLIVVRENGMPMTFPTAALRAIAKIGSFAILFIGFFLAAFSPRKQSFHDLVSGTAVVYPVAPSLTFS